MTNPPKQKKTQHGYVQSAVRMPPELRDELREAAESHGRTMNAEILARLQSDKLDAVMSELTDLKAMLRKVMDAVT